MSAICNFCFDGSERLIDGDIGVVNANRVQVDDVIIYGSVRRPRNLKNMNSVWVDSVVVRSSVHDDCGVSDDEIVIFFIGQ